MLNGVMKNMNFKKLGDKVNKYFYHVYIEDEDNNIETDYAYFTKIENAWIFCADLNEELGNSYEDFEEVARVVNEWGREYCGVFTIERCEFDDVV